MQTQLRLGALCAFFFAHSVSLFAQGSLTPPVGAPAPTMKTLQQIEPRIDLQNAPVAAITTTNPNYHFIINQPGSYYLSANLSVTKPNGIQINAEGVTLDLHGFQISRAAGTGGNGIEIAAASHRASVRHGSLKGFATGIGGSAARACAFRDLSVSNCTFRGMDVGVGAVLESCRAHDNSGEAGIAANNGSTLTNCSASNNTASYGIFAGLGSTFTNCSASNNTAIIGILAGDGSTLTNCSAYNNAADYGIFVSTGSSLTNCSANNNTGSFGIFASTGSTLTNCSAYSNTSAAASSGGIGTGPACTLSHCTASGNISTAGSSTPTTGMGFGLAFGNTIHDCTATSNEGDGINITSDTVARSNTCGSNGAGGDGAGIHAGDSDNRIEGNNVTDNDRGIDVDVAGNLIIKNSASGNTTNNWDVVAGNVILVINATTAAAVTGNSGGTASGSTDPSANFTY